MLHGAGKGCLLGVMTGNRLMRGKWEKNQLGKEKTAYWARAWKMEDQLEP